MQNDYYYRLRLTFPLMMSYFYSGACLRDSVFLLRRRDSLRAREKTTRTLYTNPKKQSCAVTEEGWTCQLRGSNGAARPSQVGLVQHDWFPNEHTL